MCVCTPPATVHVGVCGSDPLRPLCGPCPVSFVPASGTIGKIHVVRLTRAFVRDHRPVGYPWSPFQRVLLSPAYGASGEMVLTHYLVTWRLEMSMPLSSRFQHEQPMRGLHTRIGYLVPSALVFDASADDDRASHCWARSTAAVLSAAKCTVGSSAHAACVWRDARRLLCGYARGPGGTTTRRARAHFGFSRSHPQNP